MFEKEVERAARDDPDAQPLSDEKLAPQFPAEGVDRLAQAPGPRPSRVRSAIHAQPENLQEREQGQRQPEDVARAYLRVIERNPDAVRAALED